MYSFSPQTPQFFWFFSSFSFFWVIAPRHEYNHRFLLHGGSERGQRQQLIPVQSICREEHSEGHSSAVAQDTQVFSSINVLSSYRPPLKLCTEPLSQPLWVSGRNGLSKLTGLNSPSRVPSHSEMKAYLISPLLLSAQNDLKDRCSKMNRPFPWVLTLLQFTYVHPLIVQSKRSAWVSMRALLKATCTISILQEKSGWATLGTPWLSTLLTTPATVSCPIPELIFSSVPVHLLYQCHFFCINRHDHVSKHVNDCLYPKELCPDYRG